MNAASHDPTLDRRRHRSEDPLDALTRLLEAARQRAGLDALAVADSAGLVVAGAGAAQLVEELAAWAPVGVHPAANDGISGLDASFAGRARLRRLQVSGGEVVVASLGERGGPGDVLEHVSAGCRRILSHGPSAL